MDNVPNSDVHLSPTEQHHSTVKLINEALLKRVEFLCELSDLQTNRKFLLSSLDELGVTIGDEWKANFAHVNDRSEAQENPASNVCQDRSIATANGFIQTNPPMEPDLFFAAIDLSAEEAYMKFKNDWTHLKQKEDTFNLLINDLSNLEFKLQESLATLETNFAGPERFQDIELDIAGTEHDSVFSIRSGNSDCDIPPLLHEFFSCQANIGVFRERLQELEYHHEEGGIERELLKERGHPLEISDEEYKCRHDKRRLAIQNDLSIALEASETVARRCHEEGINVSQTMNDSVASFSIVSGSNTRMSDAPRATASEPACHPSRAAKVVRWLQSVIGQQNDSG